MRLSTKQRRQETHQHTSVLMCPCRLNKPTNELTSEEIVEKTEMLGKRIITRLTILNYRLRRLEQHVFD